METLINTIRLGPSDVPKLRELNALLAEAFSEPDTYEDRTPSRDYLIGWLDNRDHIAIAGVVGDVIVGGLVAYALEKAEQARTEIYIYDLAVAQAYRRQGIASALIRHLQETARGPRPSVIFVQADYDDEAAIALYERFGKPQKVLHFDIAPEGISP